MFQTSIDIGIRRLLTFVLDVYLTFLEKKKYKEVVKYPGRRILMVGNLGIRSEYDEISGNFMP